MNDDNDVDLEELPEDDAFLHQILTHSLGGAHELQIAVDGKMKPLTSLEITMASFDAGTPLYEREPNEREPDYIYRCHRRVSALLVRHCITRSEFSKAKVQTMSNHKLFRRHDKEADKKIRWSLGKVNLPVERQRVLFNEGK